MTKFYLCLILFISGLLSIENVNAQTNVTPAPAPATMCAASPSFTTLGAIYIVETDSSAFKSGPGQTYIMSLPANFQFNTGVTPTVTTNTGSGITNIVVSAPTATSFTFTYKVSTASETAHLLDSLIITNLQVQAITAGSSGNLVRSGGTAVQTGNDVAAAKNHCTLSSVSGVAITSQPVANSICAGGSNVTIFNITATGAGLTYSWERDNNDNTDGSGFDPISPGLLAFYSNATTASLVDISPALAQNGFLFRCVVSSTCGGPITSNGVALGVFNPASTTDPSNQSVCSGSNATFTVTGTNAVSYQWQENGVNINNGGVYSGATTNTLTLTGVTTAMGLSGKTYRCIVTGHCGSPATSAAKTLTVKAATVITSQPQNDTVCVGANKTFSITATGTNLTYLWGRNKFDGGGFYLPGAPTPYSGETTPNFLISNEQANQNGYLIRCVVTGDCGTVISDTAINTVYAPGSINFFGLTSSYCSNSPVDTLNGFTTTGVFGGTGITNLGGGKAVLNPAVGSSGSRAITYTLGCTNTKNTTINAATPIAFTNPPNANPSFGIADPPVTMEVQAVPPTGPLTGTFTGTGVAGNQFRPVESGPGVFPVTFTYSNSNGCVSKVVKTMTVSDTLNGIHPLLIRSPYCENAKGDSVILTVYDVDGNPAEFLEGPYSGFYTYWFEGPGITALPNKQWVFKPTVPGSYPIYFKYTVFGFFLTTYATETITVNPQTATTLTGIPPGICSTTSPFNLIPAPGIITGQAGTGLSIISPVSPPAGMLYGDTINPSAAGSGTFIVRYHYINSNGCITDLDKNVVINGQPPVPVVKLQPGYCVSDIPFQMNVDTTGLNVFTESFTDTDFPVLGSAVSGKAFVPTTATPGKHTIKYTYTNKYGCGNSSDTVVYVYGLPTPVFSISKFCATDKTFFSAKQSLQATDGVSQINKWSWDFGNPNSSTDISSLDSTFYIYPRTTDVANNDKQTFLVRLTIGTDRGCSKTDTTSIIVGNIPLTDFGWKGICPSDPFTSFGDSSHFSPVEVASYAWDFSDSDLTGNSLRNPNHKLPGTGAYDVKFKISSIRGCSDSITRKVSILDTYKPNPSDPYTKTFGTTDGFWSVDGKNPSWEWGTASKSTIVSSRKVWVTDTVGTYNADEKSYLNGPCINFKDLTKPMISLKIWSATDNNKLAGTAFQYSKDGGTTWNLVGAQGDGVNWYDSDGIVGNPGNQITKQYGWTGVDAGWRVAKIGLSSLAGDSSVRIRLAFGSVNFLLRDGFALDSIWIGERDKVSLVENFTNATSTSAATADAKINALVAKRPNDLLAIHYHTGFPGTDQINLKDQADPASRVLYYGVPSVPYAAYEGNYNYGAVLDTNDVDRRSLDHAKFGIKLNTVINSDSVFVKTLITAQENVSNDFVVHIVAVERNVANAQGTFKSVMTRMLPNASGTFFNQNFNIGDSSYLQQTWKFLPGEVYNADSLGVVVFVQDNATHEIYQAAYKFGSGNYGGIVLGLNDPEAELKVHVYPNPSSESSFVLFNKKVTEDYDWEVYDQLGKIIDSGKLRKGSEGFALNTSIYPPALYVVKIGNGKELLYTKMLVVH